MRRILAVVLVMLIFSCSAPRSLYYFDVSNNLNTDARTSLTKESSKGGDSVVTLVLADDNLLTASIGIENYQYTIVRLDTGKVPNDSLRKKPDRRLTKEEYKKAYEEKQIIYEERKRAYEEKDAAYKEMREVRAANKDKRKDILTILGAILISIAVVAFFGVIVSGTLGGLALIVGIPGVIFSLIGLKSRIWGMSVASLIIAGVLATLGIAYLAVSNVGY